MNLFIAIIIKFQTFFHKYCSPGNPNLVNVFSKFSLNNSQIHFVNVQENFPEFSQVFGHR